MFNSIKLIAFNWQFWFRLLLAFLVPFLLFSSIMNIVADNVNDMLGGDPVKPRVALVGKDAMPAALLNKIESEARIIDVPSKGEIELFLYNDSFDIALVFPKGFYVDSVFTGGVEVYYNSMQNGDAVNHVLDLVEDYEDLIVADQIQKIGLEKKVINPIVLEETNTFSPTVMLYKTMEQIKGALSNVLNLLFVLFIIWLVRNLILRAEHWRPSSFGANLVVIFIATLLATAFVFVGFQTGVNADVEGMLKGIILSIQQLLVWNKLSSILWLWWPTWLFIIGLLGCIATYSKNELKAHSRTFWVAVIIQVVALWGLMPIIEISLLETISPILNVFAIGQLALKGTLDPSAWWMAFGATTFWAVVVNFLWYRIKKNKAID